MKFPDEFGHGRAVVRHDCCHPPMKLAVVVFGAKVDCRPLLRHSIEPITTERVRSTQLQNEQGLTHRALAGQKGHLAQWKAFKC